MKISTSSRYGLRFMIDLARNYKKDPRSLARVAKDQQISLKYLGQIAIKLRRNGLILSSPGPLGGYSLARSPENISALDIIQTFESVSSPVPCLSETGKCRRVRECKSRKIWDRLGTSIGSLLGSISLKDMINENY